MANTTYIDEQGRRKTGYTEGLNIPSESIYAKRLEQLSADTQRQINNLNADYEGMNTQLYRDYMKSKKTLPQQLSAQGISGGLSESTNLGLETLYHDRLLQNEKQRQRGIGDIEAQGSSNALGVLKDYTANAAERANTMASIGDFSGYKELGYTDEQIAALKAAWDAKYAPKVSGGKRYAAPTDDEEPVDDVLDEFIPSVPKTTKFLTDELAVLKAAKVDRVIVQQVIDQALAKGEINSREWWELSRNN